MRVSVAVLALVGACRTEPALPNDVWIFEGSTVRADAIEAGRPFDGREAQTILNRVRSARRQLPQGILHTGVVHVHYAPRVVNGAEVIGLEVHRNAAAILVARDAEALDEAVWAHELVHVAWAKHERPREALAARVWDAMEEGAADHLARVAGYEPDAVRGRLRRVSPSGPPAWELLALSEPFDPHRLGVEFSRALARSGLTAAAISTCFQPSAEVRDASGPTGAMAAWLRACPDEDAARRALEGWAPGPLLPSARP